MSSHVSPAERKRDLVTIVDGGRPEIVADLAVQDYGFNLHAKARAGALDEPAPARLLRYVCWEPWEGSHALPRCCAAGRAGRLGTRP